MTRRNGKPKKAKVLPNGRNAEPQSRFARFDHEILRSPAYCSLTPNARALLMQLEMMSNGSNNGSLWLSVRDAAARLGIANLGSATRAFNDLIEAGFIAMTKEAHFSIKSADTSRARCWRLTYYFLPNFGPATNEWKNFIPTNKDAIRRMNAGLRAHADYRKAQAKEYLPVYDLKTTLNKSEVYAPKAVYKSYTDCAEADQKPPIDEKSIVDDSYTHTAIPPSPANLHPDNHQETNSKHPETPGGVFAVSGERT
tara:strand:- start:5474 stop:6235 length:762 start_codon:yes stop_codon:yes gene_type:complete